MRHRIITALLAALSAGCAVEPDVFLDEFPDAVCARAGECLGIQPLLGPDFGDLGSGDPCVEAWTVAVEDVAAVDVCEYDGGQARQCLAALEGPCDEQAAVYYECKRVYQGESEDCQLDVSITY